MRNVNWDAIEERRAMVEDIATNTMVPRIQELDAILSMLLDMRDSGADNINGYSAESIINIMLPHLRDMARDCLKITDEMVGIDSDTSPLGDDEPQSA